MQAWEQEVKWLRQRVAMDDIYEFTLQMFLTAEVLMCKLKSVIDLEAERKKDLTLDKWLISLEKILELREQNYQGNINISVKVSDEDNITG